MLKREMMVETRAMRRQTDKTPESLAAGWLSPEGNIHPDNGPRGIHLEEELTKSSPSLFVQINLGTGLRTNPLITAAFMLRWKG